MLSLTPSAPVPAHFAVRLPRSESGTRIHKLRPRPTCVPSHPGETQRQWAVSFFLSSLVATLTISGKVRGVGEKSNWRFRIICFWKSMLSTLSSFVENASTRSLAALSRLSPGMPLAASISSSLRIAVPRKDICGSVAEADSTLITTVAAIHKRRLFVACARGFRSGGQGSLAAAGFVAGGGWQSRRNRPPAS